LWTWNPANLTTNSSIVLDICSITSAPAIKLTRSLIFNKIYKQHSTSYNLKQTIINKCVLNRYWNCCIY
jgi:nicotinic acid phosphoribosyltransferase